MVCENFAYIHFFGQENIPCVGTLLARAAQGGIFANWSWRGLEGNNRANLKAREMGWNENGILTPVYSFGRATNSSVHSVDIFARGVNDVTMVVKKWPSKALRRRDSD
jgi:hypothetical protein